MTEKKLEDVVRDLDNDPSILELVEALPHEVTQHGVAPPPRGSTALPRRPPFLQAKPPDIAASNSDARRARTEARRHVDEQDSRPPVTRPPPTDDAGTPESASAARAEAKRAVAEDARVVAETAREVQRLEVGVNPATRNWIIVILGMLGLTGGTALYGAVRDPVPEQVKQAPVVVTDQQRDIDRVREDLGQCRSDVRDLERDLKRTNRNVESLTGKVNELIDRTPRIEGVRTAP